MVLVLTSKFEGLGCALLPPRVGAPVLRVSSRLGVIWRELLSVFARGASPWDIFDSPEDLLSDAMEE